MQRLEGRYAKYACSNLFPAPALPPRPLPAEDGYRQRGSPDDCGFELCMLSQHATEHGGKHQASMFLAWQTEISTLIFMLLVSVAVWNVKDYFWFLQCMCCLLSVCMSASCFQCCNLCSVGGLKKGLVVELANGSNAMVLEVTGDTYLSPLTHACTDACNSVVCILGHHTKPPRMCEASHLCLTFPGIVESINSRHCCTLY